MWLEILHRSWGEREEWKKLMARAGGLEVYAMPVCRKVFCALLTVRGRNLWNAYVPEICKREMGSVGAPAVVPARALRRPSQ